MTNRSSVLKVGAASLCPRIADGCLQSLGSIEIEGVPLRNPLARFLPWIDSYQGDVFRLFRLRGIESRGDRTVLLTRAISDPDTPFMERRDSSGDVCLRKAGWDSDPVEADFRIFLAPAAAEIDGIAFTGFRYWFEYDCAEAPIHRLLDRQTWEIGGSLDDVTVVCRNLFDLPKKRVSRETGFSTVGLDQWAGLLPGNLWARWSLLPAFDMQYGEAGVLLGWFDRVSCIRTAIESQPGEDWIRYADLHYFEQSPVVLTNPRTILWSPDRLDDVDALNLWTRVHDQEHEKARSQFGMAPDEPPMVRFALNLWKDFHFDRTYEKVIDVAAEFGADYVFIDPVWQNGETFRSALENLAPPEAQRGTVLEKFLHSNMCCTLDFEVSETAGGEVALRGLCDRARAKGLKIMSWMAAHYWPRAALQKDPALKHGLAGVFAAKESGRHPDTGYPGDCWTINMNGPIYDRVRRQLLGVCERTGLAGFLWDSFSNLGWWQVDYSDGSMRPQFDRMMELYASLDHAGLYLQPEAITSFTSHSCCGLFGGNVYAGDLLGYSYNTGIDLTYAEGEGESCDGNQGEAKDQATEVLCGRKPFSVLFQCFAHRRVPSFAFQEVPREEWNQSRVEQIKDLVVIYRKVRHLMQRRTVLREGRGVCWDNVQGTRLIYSFAAQTWPVPVTDAVSGVTNAEGRMQAGRLYVQVQSE